MLEDLFSPPTWRLHRRLCNIMRNISTNISTLGQRTHLKLGELSSLLIGYNSSFFFYLIQCMVFDFIFYCVTLHTLYPFSFVFSPKRFLRSPKARVPCNTARYFVSTDALSSQKNKQTNKQI